MDGRVKPLCRACSCSFGGGAPNKYWLISYNNTEENAKTSSEPAVLDKSVKVIVVKAIQGLLVCYSKSSMGYEGISAFSMSRLLYYFFYVIQLLHFSKV